MSPCNRRGAMDKPCPDHCIYEEGVVDDSCFGSPRPLAWQQAQNIWSEALR